ncbi:MAG: DUF480 domain-containing protein [Planctomycetes bacterium]|nr:DUF480 domain-containing protein [Planctomycetota bacterium]
MSAETVPPAPSPSHGPIELTPIERRVLGVLIEKGLTTPEQYPLTLNALVNGCNQKSNRDPIVNYDEVQVDSALQLLIRKGLAANATGFSGRAERFSSQMGKMYELRTVEIAVIGELMLRGAQTEGELRIRASRMRPIEDLPALHEILTKLRAATPPFIVRLTPEGHSRGVRHTHTFYMSGEMKRIISEEATRAPDAGETAFEIAPPPPDVLAELRAQIASLEARIAALERKSAGQ